MTPAVVDREAYAEAFDARYARLVVTAADEHWLNAAVTAVTGYGTSVIGCDAEVGVERGLLPDETHDGRPGAAIMAFGFAAKKLGHSVANRIGQCLLTCPTVAVFDGLPEAHDRAPLGDYLRYFGDGYELQTKGGWSLPIMEGKAMLPTTMGVGRGVAGGNLVFAGSTADGALDAARRAVDAIAPLPGVVTPFPGGVCRSGSKVGSRYKNLVASTNEAYCPTLADRVETKLPAGAKAAYEVIIDGENEAAVRDAMRRAIEAAPGEGLLTITAASYGGQLGKVLLRLSDVT
ncbi:MAG: formylmethanofuran--tetrahydromethanopterin N-formyltransferase [Planctomycetota bacterium]